MSERAFVYAAIACFSTSAVNAGAGCDPQAMPGYRDSLLLVDSLRPEKPGQMRVFAADGSEFTAGQAQWMKGQLQRAQWLCARHGNSDPADAAASVAAVQGLLKSHQRRS